jgi:chromatin remodeling complex protein RSC6
MHISSKPKSKQINHILILRINRYYNLSTILYNFTNDPLNLNALAAIEAPLSLILFEYDSSLVSGSDLAETTIEMENKLKVRIKYQTVKFCETSMINTMYSKYMVYPPRDFAHKSEVIKYA